MKNVLNAFPKIFIWLLLVSALSLTGCASSETAYDPAKPQLTPLSNQSTIRLSAEDIVLMMRQVGFSDEQILDLGATMRDGLLNSGAAQLEINDKIEAIFAVNKKLIYVATRSRGSFIYDVESGQVLTAAQVL
jgi:hypothetical protein